MGKQPDEPKSTNLVIPIELRRRIESLADKARRPFKPHTIVLLEKIVAQEEKRN